MTFVECSVAVDVLLVLAMLLVLLVELALATGEEINKLPEINEQNIAVTSKNPIVLLFNYQPLIIGALR